MDKKWLEAQFKLNPEKKKADLAKALDLEAPAISKILAGIREVKAPEYVIMRKFFGLPNDGSKAYQHQKDAYIIQPLNVKNAHGGMQEKIGKDAGNWVMPDSLVKEKTSANPGDVMTYRIEEDAMSPEYKVGQDVLVNTAMQKPSPSGVFLISDGMGAILRRCEYIPQSNPPAMRVSAVKEGYESHTMKIQPETIIGRVVAKIDWVG